MEQHLTNMDSLLKARTKFTDQIIRLPGNWKLVQERRAGGLVNASISGEMLTVKVIVPDDEDLESFVGKQGLQPSFGYDEGGVRYVVPLHYIRAGLHPF